jgi:DNA-binding LacI/PurR family transcriptional regulator
MITYVRRSRLKAPAARSRSRSDRIRPKEAGPARPLRSGRTGVIGLALPEIGRPYFGQLAAHVIAQAAKRGFHVSIEQTGADAAGEMDAIAHSHTLHFDGLF